VTFEVKCGERVGIIGRNGAGKSTLLKVLSRITEPTSGRVGIKGRVASLLEVGTGFHPELTGRENIFLNGAILGMPRAEIRKKFDEIVAFAEVEKFLDTPVKRFSSGMYVRLAFAVAAHLEPEILIVDEVLAVGDAQFQKKCLGKLDEVSNEHGRTVLFVSHNMSAISRLCTRGLLFHEGRIVPTDGLDDCIGNYTNINEQFGSSWQGEAGDGNISVYRLEVIGGVPGRPGVFNRGEVFDIVLDYEVLLENKDFVIGVEFYNTKGSLLCLNRLTDDAGALRYLERGRDSVSLRCDSSLFAEGEYFIKLDVGIHNTRRIIEDQFCLFFKVISNEARRQVDTSVSKSMIYPDWTWQGSDGR
jgi:lipopolysaccharide transport system ATP-binding protein